MMHSGCATIRVLLFAALRETMGVRSLDVDVAEGATPEDVFRKLVEREPNMAALRRHTSFAVNREMVPADTTLHNGDELALLQPVSGGSDA